jgi:DNA topoisomerase-1
MQRLVKVTRDALTVSRRRKGKGFCYYDGNGALVCDPELKSRYQSLGIPPAWQDVRISPKPNAHLQATGRDEAGRLQYIYHPDWEERRTSRKQKQLALLSTALPRVRRRVSRDLEAEPGSQELALAIAVALIDRTAMRIGRERYLKTSGTRGAGTLFTRDVRVDGKSVRLTFPAKSGKTASYELSDRRLVNAIARIKTLSGRRLLLYKDESGAIRPITGEMINAYLRAIANADVTAKDFRTLHASALAAETLAELAPGPSQSARKRQIASVTKKVAEFLRNTPAISRKSYIAPCLFRLFDDGQLQVLWANGSNGAGGGIRQREKRLSEILSAVT